jgi:hypothetical protein
MNPQENGKLIPIKDEKSYMRDSRSGAVILNDKAKLDKYNADKAAKFSEIKLRQEVADLKQQLAEISAQVKKLQKE